MSKDGHLIELLARGAQDNLTLSNDIDLSLFKSVYTKHTNFSRGTIDVNFKGNGKWGSTIKFTIPRDSGDLLSSMYLNLKLPDISVENIKGYNNLSTTEQNRMRVRWTDYIGNALIERATLKIGGQIIDEQYGLFMQLHTDLYDDDWNKLMMLGHDSYLNRPRKNIESDELFIPLKFWFSETPETALPLIALQNHDVELEIKFSNFDNCYSVLRRLDNGELVHTDKKLDLLNFDKINLLLNMVYLDNVERRKVSEMNHKLLVTQVQRRQISISGDNQIDLNFNNQVKELIFFIQPLKNINQGELFNFSSKLEYLSNEYQDIEEYDKEEYNNLPKYHLLDQARILFNGTERETWRNYKYYFYLQNYEHYRNATENYVYLYSFSMNPTSFSPSGSCNFSRLDNATLQFKVKQVPKDPLDIIDENSNPQEILINGSIANNNPAILTVYATNYNYLVIKGGMGGLLFNN